MLMVSANDAAVAIAERIGGGSLAAWTVIAQQTADRLGLTDRPVLADPAGLDDVQFSNGGGSRISARDLGIVARAVLARPDLMAVLQTPRYEFTGGDNLGHRLNNQDLFLSLYAGATGMKTGTTDKAGHTFVGSATRDGRTMLVVVLDAADPLRSAAALLDQGFATPVLLEPTTDVLPSVVPDAAVTPTALAPMTSTPMATAPDQLGTGADATTPRPASGAFDSAPVAASILAIGLVLLVFVRRAMVEHFQANRQVG
jgi:D-alanyl-D-alanine carboxypeptidase